MVIKDASCEVRQGTSADAKITSTSATRNFVKLITGQLDGTMALPWTGKLKLKGDMGLAMRLTGFVKLPS